MESRRQSIRILFASLCTITVFCGRVSYCCAEQPDNQAGPTPVEVGVILPLTGPFRRYGAQIQTALSSYSSDKIRFHFEDEGCEPKMAVTAYKKLTGINGIAILMGPWCGSPQLAVAPLVKANGQIALLGSSAPEAVWAASGGRMFSVQATIEKESTFLAERMNERGIKSVAIVYRENQFSKAHENAFRRAFQGSVLDTLTYASDDLTDLKAIALKIRSLKPDALFVPDAYPLLGGFMKELRAAVPSQIPVYSVYSIQSPDVLTAVGVQGEGIIYSHPAVPGQAYEHYAKVAGDLIVSAIDSCGNNPECIMKIIRASNPFDENGTLISPLILKTIKNGSFVPME